jgi:hypothetical protein
MAKYSLIGATVSIDGTSSCVEAGDVDFGDRNLVETTCSTDAVKTYVAGTLNNATGNVTLNDTGALTDWLAAYDDGLDTDTPPPPVTVIFTWPDTGEASLSVSAVITNVNAPVGVNQNAKWSFRFSGVANLTFTP